MANIRHGVYVRFEKRAEPELYAVEAPAQATDRQILKIARNNLKLAKSSGIIHHFSVEIAPSGLGGVTLRELNAAATLPDVG